MKTKPIYAKFEVSEKFYSNYASTIEDFFNLFGNIRGVGDFCFVGVDEDPMTFIVEDIISNYRMDDIVSRNYVDDHAYSIAEYLCEHNDFIDHDKLKNRLKEYVVNVGAIDVE